MRKILEPLSLRLVRDDPRIGRHIGNRILSRNKGPPGEALIEHGIEPVCLILVALDRVSNLFGRILPEMMILPGHGTEVANLPEQPFEYLRAAGQILREELSSFFGEIDQDRAGFEDGDRRAAVCRSAVDDRRNTVVRRDRQKPGLELLAAPDVDRMNRVRDFCFCEEYRDLVPVRGRPIIKLDHRGVPQGSYDEARGQEKAESPVIARPRMSA